MSTLVRNDGVSFYGQHNSEGYGWPVFWAIIILIVVSIAIAQSRGGKPSLISCEEVDLRDRGYYGTCESAEPTDDRGYDNDDPGYR